VRVEDVRPTAMSKLLPMLADPALFTNARAGAAASREEADAAAAAAAAAEGAPASAAAAAAAAPGESSILYAAAWIVGEFCAIIPAAMHGAVIDALLGPAVATLPAPVQAAYVQCLLKVLAAAAAAAAKADAGAAFARLAASVLDRLHAFAQSAHVEVQERACLAQQLLATLGVPFTPLATPASAAAAKAAADAELLALASGDAPAAKPASPAKLAAGLAPLDFDVKLVAAILSSLFAEQLKPVNSKAQKRVPVPAGLSLDAWINADAAAAAAAEDELGAFAISFEDSYGLADDDFAGRPEGAGGARRRGADKYATEGGDADDDAWFDSMAKKNKKRDAELWGGDEEKKGKKGKDAGKARKAPAGGDPFMIKKGSGGGGGGAADDDEDGIPIRTLGAAELGGVKAGALDVSIFGDFAKGGAKAAAGGKKKKGKKGAAADEDDEAPAGGARPAFKVMDDDEGPAGGADDDDAGGVAGAGDALANIDLTTPLGDDEVLPAAKHRSVRDPAALGGAAAKKSGGRARVLAPAEEEAPKKKKKDAAGEEEPKKKKKDAAGGGGAAAAAAAAAPAAADKKAKKAAKAAAAAAEPDLAEGEAHCFALCADKVVAVSYAVSGASAAAGGAVGISFRAEAKSTKKALEWVEVAFAGEGAPSARVGALGARVKGAPPPAKRAGLRLPAPAPGARAVRVSYKVEGADKVVVLEGAVLLRGASLLVATALEQAAFKALLTSPAGAAFAGAEASLPLLPAGAEATLALVRGVARAFQVAGSAAHTILYAKTLAGGHFTLVAKADAASIVVKLKAEEAGVAAAVLQDLEAALAEAAAGGKEKGGEE